MIFKYEIAIKGRVIEISAVTNIGGPDKKFNEDGENARLFDDFNRIGN